MGKCSTYLTVGLLLIKDRKVLLMRRCNTGYMDGCYALTSGHVEVGEDLKQAMIREAKEEIGIDIEPGQLDYVTMIRNGKDNADYINFFLIANGYSGTPSIMEPDKCDDLGWFDVDNLPDNMIPADRKAISNYFNEVYFDEFGFPGFVSNPAKKK